MTPQIIRTREELAALDPDTLLRGRYEGDDWQQHVADLKCCDVMWRPWVEYALPAVVIATGDEVRAARQALAEADREPETDDFHNSLGLWQLPLATWEEA